jgi:hypothetical protein
MMFDKGMMDMEEQLVHSNAVSKVNESRLAMKVQIAAGVIAGLTRSFGVFSSTESRELLAIECNKITEAVLAELES